MLAPPRFQGGVSSARRTCRSALEVQAVRDDHQSAMTQGRAQFRGTLVAGTEIPASHRDLAECPSVAALTTLMRDGDPQTSPVWCDLDGADVRVNTMRGFQKE